MGQQQLLLVILVTIIVGIATVVAINTFSSSAEQANRDAVRQDIASITAAAQAWSVRPTMLEGGGGTFTGLNFDRMNFSYSTRTSPTVVANQNGEYTITSADADGFVITATPSSASGNIIGTFRVTAGSDPATEPQGLTIVTTP